ncbi:MAG: polymer-forming cytoskeletal protein, partial [Planctomycetaceae bacterium]|nr:polymer-forming cytoskeletal protein [Planctomycetaceae bacterium]
NTISKGTSLQGNIETDANLRIEGRMKGDVKARSTFSVGEGAVVEGNIAAESAEIAGEIRGQLEVSTVLVLKSTAIVHGDILTDKFVVEAGAQFNGSCKMGQQASPLKLPAVNPANGRRPEAAVASN